MDRLIIERVINIALRIQQIPAPTFAENQRADLVYRCFTEEGLQDITRDNVGNVYARIKGRGERPPLVISAHLDTVFPVNTDLSVTFTQERIAGSGIGDNSLGLAGLFGLFWSLRDHSYKQKSGLQIPGDIWLVANVGEEGLGNLKGMKAVVDRFGAEVSGYIILEGMSLGQIYHRGLGVKRYLIRVHTKGGHSWVDYGNPSAIHELANLVVKITDLELPTEPRTTCNVGMITGGTSINTIAAEASIQLDLRSTSPEVLDYLSTYVEELVNHANREGGDNTHVFAEVIGERPAGEIPVSHPLVKFAIESHSANGLKVDLNIGSTDANEPLSRGFPAICIGLTTGGGSHTLGEYINIKPLGQGLKILEDLVRAVFRGAYSS
jgi:tripeptide aminopeptidase